MNVGYDISSLTARLFNVFKNMFKNVLKCARMCCAQSKIIFRYHEVIIKLVVNKFASSHINFGFVGLLVF